MGMEHLAHVYIIMKLHGHYSEAATFSVTAAYIDGRIIIHGRIELLSEIAVKTRL